MRRLRARHPNRPGLRAVLDEQQTPEAPAPGGRADPAHPGCGCPVRLVEGTVWAYDRQLGWHAPSEHADWTPPYWPTA